MVNDGYSGSATLKVVNSLVTGNSVPIESDNGGGILNFGQGGNATLVVVNSTVSDNDAGFLGGGIFNNGFDGNATVTVVNSTVCGNNAGWSGGGVYNAGWSGTASLTLENSTITGNQAGSGGGVYNAGYGGTASLTVNNCAIIGNQALTIGGGGLYNGVSGGSAVLMLANSTVSGNLAATGGGIYNGDDDVLVPHFGPSNASLQILNSTLTTNSAETIYDANCLGSSTVEIGSTILNAIASGSTIGFGCSPASDSVISLGYNISSDNAGGVLTDAIDLINTDPRLGPLQGNGGPSSLARCFPAARPLTKVKISPARFTTSAAPALSARLISCHPERAGWRRHGHRRVRDTNCRLEPGAGSAAFVGLGQFSSEAATAALRYTGRGTGFDWPEQSDCRH